MAVAATPSAVSTSASPKLKLNEIVDQGCDLEVEQLPHTQLDEFRRRYVVVEGGAPTEKEEVTDAQLTCLWAKIEHGMSPFVDMGVWRAYGDRLARAMKFTSQQCKEGHLEISRNPRGIESSGLGRGLANFSHCSTDAQLGDCSNFRPLLCLLQGEAA